MCTIVEIEINVSISYPRSAEASWTGCWWEMLQQTAQYAYTIYKLYSRKREINVRSCQTSLLCAEYSVCMNDQLFHTSVVCQVRYTNVYLHITMNVFWLQRWGLHFCFCWNLCNFIKNHHKWSNVCVCVLYSLVLKINFSIRDVKTCGNQIVYALEQWILYLSLIHI